MQRIAREGAGIVVLLRPAESPLEIAEAVRTPERLHHGPHTPRGRDCRQRIVVLWLLCCRPPAARSSDQGGIDRRLDGKQAKTVPGSALHWPFA